jgi:hypothetical protein
MYFAPAVAPKVAYSPYPLGVSWDAWEPAWTSALARGASGHAALYQLGYGLSAFLSVALVDAASQNVYVLNDMACANAPFAADIVPTKGGYVIASASGYPFGSCSPDVGIPGDASFLQLMMLNEEAGSISQVAGFPGTDRIAHIELAERSEGPWVVWQDTGESAETPPPIRAVRLDEIGEPHTGVVPLTKDGETTGPFAAAMLGDRLAVAWLNSINAGDPLITLALFDEAGAQVTSTLLDVAAPFPYDASLSLLASPDGKDILLAWSDITMNGPAVVRVARFSCAPGP